MQMDCDEIQHLLSAGLKWYQVDIVSCRLPNSRQQISKQSSLSQDFKVLVRQLFSSCITKFNSNSQGSNYYYIIFHKSSTIIREFSQSSIFSSKPQGFFMREGQDEFMKFSTFNRLSILNFMPNQKTVFWGEQRNLLIILNLEKFFITFVQNKNNKQQQKQEMKFLQRNQMYETRFSSSFADLGRKDKNFSTTRTSLHNKTNYRLPRLNRAVSSSTSKSAIQKLESLDERMQDLSRKTQELRLQTRESRRFTNFLRQDLGDRLLQDHRQQLMAKINNLDKFAKLMRVNNEERTQLLKSDCQQLNDSSINLQNLMRNITERLDTIQYTMGIYSGKEKHKV